jgi:hypothetical protein
LTKRYKHYANALQYYIHTLSFLSTLYLSIKIRIYSCNLIYRNYLRSMKIDIWQERIIVASKSSPTNSSLTDSTLNIPDGQVRLVSF